MKALVNMVVGLVVVLAILAALWGTIDGFIDTLVTNETGAIADLAPLIKVFLILAVVLGVIYGAMKMYKR